MNLEIFNYENQNVRTIIRDNDVWFVAKDICDLFGETNRNRAMQSLDEDEKGYTQMNTPGGIQEVAIVNESGLYTMLFAMQPTKARGVSEDYIYDRMDKLRKFKRWVTHDILPTIRKTGGYVANDQLFIDTYLPFADDITKKLFSSTLEIVKNQNRLIGEMKPKVDYFDKLVDRNLLTNFRDTAKELNISPKEFNEYLVQSRYIYRDKKGKLKPYQPHVKNGLFELKEYYNHNSKHVDTQTLITPKGRETFRLLFQ